MGWCSVSVGVGTKSWHDRLTSRTDSKHNSDVDHLIDIKRRSRTIPLWITGHATRERKWMSVKMARSAELYGCFRAPALLGHAKLGRYLRRVQHEGCIFSCLLCALSSSDLALHLLASPSGSIDGSRLKLSVGSCLFDHSHQPFGTIVLREFAVREGFSKVTRRC